MSTLNQLIIVINLLYNRRSVSIKSITNICNVSERTAYRYLDAISRAGIPLYYDKDHRGYSLSRRNKLPLDNLGINEIVIILSALKYLSKHLEGYYKESTENLLRKIESTHDIAIEDITRVLEAKCTREMDGDELSDLITFLLLQATIRLKMKAKIRAKRENRSVEIHIEHPKLRFMDDWKILENEANPGESIPLSRIQGVHIKS